MWKLALAFVAGGAAGWFARFAADPTATTPSSATAPAAEPPARDAAAPIRRSRVRSQEPGGAPGTLSVGDKAKKVNAVIRPAPAEKALTDTEVGALLADANPIVRRKGLDWAAHRGLITVAQLLDRARSDPDRDVRFEAFDLAAGRASEEDGTMEVAAAEILAWARDPDPDRRAAGLRHLARTGARGAPLGRELLDAGGLPGDVYSDAVRTLVAARRFDRLAPESLDNELRGNLTTVLSGALEDDASIAPHVVAVLREAGPPASVDQVADYCHLAILAGAPSLVRDFVKSPSAAAEARALALQVLIEDEAQAPSAVALAEDVLTDASSPAGLRRRILDAVGNGLMHQGPSGLAVLRRVGDHDANLWVRDLASYYVAEAAPR